MVRKLILKRECTFSSLFSLGEVWVISAQFTGKRESPNSARSWEHRPKGFPAIYHVPVGKEGESAVNVEVNSDFISQAFIRHLCSALYSARHREATQGTEKVLVCKVCSLP